MAPSHLDPKEGAQVIVIRAGNWQAARSAGEYTLVSCVVGPGFDFSDFGLLSGEIEIQKDVLKLFPEAKDFC